MTDYKRAKKIISMMEDEVEHAILRQANDELTDRQITEVDRYLLTLCGALGFYPPRKISGKEYYGGDA